VTASAICGEIADLAGYRDFFVHGSITQMILEPPSSFQFTRLDRRPDNHGYEEVYLKLSGAELLKLSTTAFEIAMRLSDVGRHVREVIETQKAAKE